MAGNSFSELVLPLLATKVAKYLPTKSAILGRCRIENRSEVDVRQGGGSVIIPLPTPPKSYTPATLSFPTTPTYNFQDISIPSVTVNLNIMKRVQVRVTDLENRQSAGNLEAIIDLTLPSMLDSHITYLDQQLVALTSGLSTTPVGTAGGALALSDITDGLAALSSANVDPAAGDVHMVLGDQVYWKQYINLSNSNSAIAFALGNNNQLIQKGDAGNVFNCRVAYSPNISQGVGSPATSKNILFHKDAFVVCFQNFIPAPPEWGGKERLYTDPVTGISLRLQTYYDPTVGSEVLNIDLLCGISAYAADRGVVIQTK